MAYATDIRTGSHISLSDRVHAVMESFRISREQNRLYKQTRDELNSLSHRELDDLGIDSSEIPFIARQAAAMAK